nr:MULTISPECIES: flagellar transcriptional regulator FlhC [Chromohalobacter]
MRSIVVSEKSLVGEMLQVQLAIELIDLGARLQVLETETDLSRGRLIKLYKEVRGMSPPKGMLPFSTDWFITWMPNIHSSLFYNIYWSLLEDCGCERMSAFVKAFKLYLEQVSLEESEPVLGLTRAWTLIRFFESGMMQLSACTSCGGQFVAHAYSPDRDFVCGICQPPSRAGKTRKKRQAEERVATPRRQPVSASESDGMTARRLVAR